MPRKKHFEFSWKEEFSQEVRAARLWTKKKLPAHMSNYLGRISSSGGHHGHKLRTQWPNLARARRFKLAWSKGNVASPGSSGVWSTRQHHRSFNLVQRSEILDAPSVQTTEHRGQEEVEEWNRLASENLWTQVSSSRPNVRKRTQLIVK